MKHALLVFLLSMLAAPLAAQAPALPEQAIFYWGEFQANLRRKDGFKATVQVDRLMWRKSLLTQPRFWDGKGIRRDFSFTIQNMPISVAFERDTYVQFIPALDHQLAENAQAGDSIVLHHIPIAEGTFGQITVHLTQKEVNPNKNQDALSDPMTVSLKGALTAVRIGPIFDSKNTGDRDFFTVAEFWETMRTVPQFQWSAEEAPFPLAIRLDLLDLPFQPPSPVFDFDSTTYSSFLLGSLRAYAHLIKPGIAAQLHLVSKDTDRDVFSIALQLVADDDPRLALRRSKQHKAVQFKWGKFTLTKYLYLQAFPASEGQPRYADRPSNLRLMQPFDPNDQHADGEDAYAIDRAYRSMFQMRPQIIVDGLDIGPFSFDLKYDNQTYTIASNELLPPDLQEKLMSALESETHNFVFLDVKHIRPSKKDYVLEPMVYHLMMANYGKYVSKNYTYFNNQRESSQVKIIALEPEARTSGDLSVRIRLNKPCTTTLRVFDAQGRDRYSAQGDFTEGESVIKVPLGFFNEGEPYRIFLDTPLGVAKADYKR